MEGWRRACVCGICVIVVERREVQIWRHKLRTSLGYLRDLCERIGVFVLLVQVGWVASSKECLEPVLILGYLGL